ncbi:UNVERIFIED: hypothetical protein OPA17_44 [Vibrio phage OPA17]|nr:hypothetical protein OTA22_45 [Vibrio phage OTA22]
MAYATENYGSERSDLIAAIKNRFEAAGFTIAHHQGEVVIIQLQTNLFVQYRCVNFLYVTRPGRHRYTNSLRWRMGTGHSNGSLTNASEEEGMGSGYSGFNGPIQHVPLPGKLHFCKTDLAGKYDYVLCLENTADAKGASCLAAELQCVDAEFGARSHHYLAGNATSGSTVEGNPGPFISAGMYTGGSGFIARIGADGNLQAYLPASTEQNYNSTYPTANSWLSVGPYGYYRTIQDKLYFDPSLTTIMLPAVWGCRMPAASGNYGGPVKGEFPQFKITTMKYAGIGTEMTLDGKKYRLFPRIGKGGENTLAYAIRES